MINTKAMDFEIIKYVACHVPDLTISAIPKGAWKDEIVERLKSKKLMPAKMSLLNVHLYAMVNACIIKVQYMYGKRYEFYYLPNAEPKKTS
jgi:hypothetical protein